MLAEPDVGAACRGEGDDLDGICDTGAVTTGRPVLLFLPCGSWMVVPIRPELKAEDLVGRLGAGSLVSAAVWLMVLGST